MSFVSQMSIFFYYLRECSISKPVKSKSKISVCLRTYCLDEIICIGKNDHVTFRETF